MESESPQLGRLNTMRVVGKHEAEAGMVLEGGEEFGGVLLPTRYVPEGLKADDEIEVFLMLDSEDRPVATTDKPLAMAGDFALLEVVASTRVGSFLNWGMPKDLLLPFGEQPSRFCVGEKALVYIYVDKVSGRLVASAKLKKFVAETAPSYVRAGNCVSLMIAEQSDMGTKAIVNDSYWGMLHTEANLEIPPVGTRCEGFISRIREADGLADVSLQPPGYHKIPAAAQGLLEKLAATKDGFLPLHDKSPPEQIRERLGISKKVFKQSVGGLYKAGRIRIEDDGIRLL